jgi:GNAT superfamily N-acetyltransferase
MADEEQIRALTRAELALALDWAAAEGWNPGLADADCFLQADEGGFLGLFVAGRLVASISVVAYDSAFAFLGLYIVAPEFRGRGLGFKLWRAGVARLGDRRIGLDGVVAQQENYARSGFRLAWRNQRYEGRGGGSEPAGLVPLATVPFAEVPPMTGHCFRPHASVSSPAGPADIREGRSSRRVSCAASA